MGKIKRYCAFAKLDAASIERFRAWEEAIVRLGFPKNPWPPHITLGLYEGVEGERVLDWTRSFAADRAPIPIQYGFLGIFGKETLFAGIVASEALMRMHKEYHAQLDEFHGPIGKHYSLYAGQFVPHTTLAIAEAGQSLEEALLEMQKPNGFEPFDATVLGIDIYAMPVKHIETFDFLNT